MKMRFKCNTCGHVTKTPQGAASHVRSKHLDVKKGGYSKTRDPVSNPNRNGPHKVKKVKRRKPIPGPIITVGTKYIDVPCTIRVSIEGLGVQGIHLAS